MSGRRLTLTGRRSGFTLIELLIVIAIILILIAIALPNFLAAQMRARVTRERSDMKTLNTAIESLRAEREVLLVDFWDDDDRRITQARFGFNGVNMATQETPTFLACCAHHRQNFRGGTTGLFIPLTTPIAYLTSVPTDPFAFERGDLELIDEDVIPPISYMYHDNEAADERLSGDAYKGVHPCFTPARCGPPGIHGILTPLGIDHYILVGFGPDSERTHSSQIPYAPTNGTTSFGDTVFRSDTGFL
ncbi:MAG: prepilin-type N-terminal cleavage/methylation domain-containing protein [Candidatus Omnitrophica bacterium]|nr:prepilin-type N-terminal cleavage/methylation domain-containing protein [Candidatus Omnitrophota bacterium]MCA9440988.1 prepilin-type N-terminal cleavage/methylation domain-containing protein [Candidatus Omnitrophota bacterium]MCB9767799.1 prepilin-type N-terminal cleavage/methylation domain-containing protein [Candidatus Omnitrophota bacterium]MCB9781962.1 prepilin-type N-terminal cleavage/methylation domain-containing protein [Candidatus Omnitrophota bacterium]